ncbi:hypothetical protein SprV_0802617600 [Sparganum proliferum]
MPWVARAALKERRHFAGESVVDCQRHLRVLALQAYPNDSYSELDARILENFVDDLVLPNIRRQFIRDLPNSMRLALDIARREEAMQTAYRLEPQSPSVSFGLRPTPATPQGSSVGIFARDNDDPVMLGPKRSGGNETLHSLSLSLSTQELEAAAWSPGLLRNNKAPGEDGIPAEIYKSCVDTLGLRLHELIERAWRDEVIPGDWGLGILVPILKKRDKTRFENYRGKILIDVAAKIFAIVLRRRFRAVHDSRTRPNQARFRAGHGCVDQALTPRSMLEIRYSYQQPTAVCFIDFAAAFDSVHREFQWRIMALDAVAPKNIAMIKAY